MLTDKNDEKITIAIIALAQPLGLKVTAEGVADIESLEILQKYGANYFQCYLLGEPQISDTAIRVCDASAPYTSDHNNNVVDILSGEKHTSPA